MQPCAGTRGAVDCPRMAKPLTASAAPGFARDVLGRLVRFGDRSWLHFRRRCAAIEGDDPDANRLRWRRGVVSAGIAYAMAMAGMADAGPAGPDLAKALRQALREWLALDGEKVPEDLDWVSHAAKMRMSGREGRKPGHGLLLGTLPLANVLQRSVRAEEADLARELGDSIAGFVPQAWEEVLDALSARGSLRSRLGCAPAAGALLAAVALIAAAAAAVVLGILR